MARGVREDLVAQACLEAYGLARHERWLADRAVEHVLRSKRTLYSTERRLVAERVYSLLRRQRLVDHVLSKRFSEALKRSPTQVDLLRFAADRVLGGEPASQVVDALALPGDWAARLSELTAPALLASLPPVERFALEASVPDALAKLLLEELGDKARAEAEAFNTRAPLAVRTNTLKTSREGLEAALSEAGVGHERCQLSPLGLKLQTRINVFSLAPFKQGLFEVQDEGSQLLGELVDARGGRVIDACAGAGGKTLQLAAQMRNKGELFALDIDGKRLGELKARARRAGAHNVRIQTLPSDDAGADAAIKPFLETADRVLIDAPCTGTGTLRRKPDARYRFDEALLREHTERQAKLLRRFAPMAKKGGRVVYGTCSILRAEGEAIVEAFLAEHPEFTLVPAEGLVPPETCRAGVLRLFTHAHGTDGFFGAVLERR